MHDFCEDNGIYYVLGQGANSKLKAAGQNWRQPRRIIHKAEVTNGEANPRYLVTNLQSNRDGFIYDDISSPCSI